MLDAPPPPPSSRSPESASSSSESASLPNSRAVSPPSAPESSSFAASSSVSTSSSLAASSPPSSELSASSVSEVSELDCSPGPSRFWQAQGTNRMIKSKTTRAATTLLVTYVPRLGPWPPCITYLPPTPLPWSGRSNSDRKSTRLNSSHANISYAVFCLKKKIT